MTTRQTAIALFTALSLALTAVPVAFAGGKSSQGIGHTGVPRTSGNTLGGRPVVGKGTDIGQTSNPSNIDNPVWSRRDRRGQPQRIISPPPKDVRPIIRPRQVRCDGHKCYTYNPYREYPNRRAQVRDHRNR
jgi:hypothetical protein